MRGKLRYEPTSRNGQGGNQHFVSSRLRDSVRIPFELVIKLPISKYTSKSLLK